MNCRECQNNLSAYVDERLDDERRTKIDAHRGDCRACEKAYRLMRRTNEVLAVEGPAEPPGGLAERSVLAAFAVGQAEPRRSFFDRWIPVAWPTAAVAAAATLLLLVATPSSPPTGAPGSGDELSVLIDDAEADDFAGEVLGMEMADEE